MDDQLNMRASDADREEVVERLRTALEQGRLKTPEYFDRMERAYEAVTYGDLAALHADLPATMVARPRPAPAAAPQRDFSAQQAAVARRGAFAGLPAPLKVLWTIWFAAVSINVVVWVLVMGTTGHLVYPWPVWVAGPYGAALFAVTAGVTRARRNRHAAPPVRPRLPSGED